MDFLIRIENRLKPLKRALLNHPIYINIDRIEALRIFMEHHVYAVWDFMSLLKALQRQLCCVQLPWLVPVDSQACRLINEIVLAEESDDDGQGGFASHFELYHRSMSQCSANTAGIDWFLSELSHRKTVIQTLASPEVPEASRDFVQQTFKVIESGNVCAIASAFTFGREDLLPDVFQRIINKLNVDLGGQLKNFQYYLQRHIDLDGDHHGPMAAQLVNSLCGSDESKWKVVEETAVDCLLSRKKLWDGINESIRSQLVH